MCDVTAQNMNKAKNKGKAPNMVARNRSSVKRESKVYVSWKWVMKYHECDSIAPIDVLPDKQNVWESMRAQIETNSAASEIMS